MVVQSLSPDADVAEIVNYLQRDGGVVVNDLAPPETVDAIADEMRVHLDKTGDYAQCKFNGYKTLRVTSILANSRTSGDLIAHERVLEVMDAILLPNCINYRVGSSTAIEILPGEKHQVLHRDDGIYPARLPGMEWQVSAMWAISDFTVENGATRVVPGSHREWMRDGEEVSNAVDDPAMNVVQTPMKKGSVLFYMGSTVHGGGANTSDESRLGLITTYSLGWLRQEVNQYLSIPRDVMESYPENIQRLMGYQTHGPNLGRFPEQPDGGWFMKDEGY